MRHKLKVKNKKGKEQYVYIGGIILGVMIFIYTKPAIAKALQSEVEVLEINDVGTEPNNDYSQIYAVINNEKVFLTNTNYTNASPQFDNNYIVWMGQKDYKWQIFLHNIETEYTMQLTNQGNNVNPKIQNGNIIWEGQSGEYWQIFLYDGISTQKITNYEYSSYNASWDNEYISYLVNTGADHKKFKFDKKLKIETEVTEFEENNTKAPNFTQENTETETEKVTSEDIEKELNIKKDSENSNDEAIDIKDTETLEVINELIETSESSESTES